MTEPLHELLRQLSIYSREKDVFWILGYRYDCEQSLLTICEHLATEIESKYIPLPCDKEGKPWKLHEECVCNGHTWTIDGLDDSEVLIGRILDDGCDTVVTKWENPLNLKRPTPPVLDPDGVEIKEEETLYGTGREQHRYTVQKPYSINEEVGKRFCVQCYDHDEGNVVWCDPSMLTHEQPVFDVNGVPCKVGDKVWYTDKLGGHRTIKKLVNGGVNLVGDGSQAITYGYELTHQEPDSLEKLRDDLKKSTVYAENPVLDQYIERLAALIERSA